MNHSRSFKLLRWSGSIETLDLLFQEVTDSFQKSTGLTSNVSTNVTFSGEAKCTLTNEKLATSIDSIDVKRIKSIWTNITLDQVDYLSKREQAKATNKPLNIAWPDYDSRPTLSFRLDSSPVTHAIEIEVTGPVRTDVLGLISRLGEILRRSAIGPTWFPSFIGKVIAAMAFGFIGGFAAVGFYGESHPKGSAPASTVLLGAGIFATVGILALWLLPPIEFIEMGQKSRFHRARLWVLSTAGAIILATIANSKNFFQK